MKTEKTTCDGKPVNRLLAKARPQNAVPVPWEILIHEPLPGTVNWKPEHPFDVHLHRRVNQFDFLAGKVIVFDLDDTLLNTNYISREAWDAERSPVKAYPSIDYSKLSFSRSYWFKAGWRKPVRQRYNSARYPFLKNPDVEAQWRPGTFALLTGLKEAGARLALATLSARLRLQFLFDRVPVFRDVFFDRADSRLNVLCAEDLAGFALPGADSGQAVSFNQKNPDVLNALLGINRMDLMIDDSPKIAGDYESRNLSGRFIRARADEPSGPVLMEVVDAIEDRLGPERQCGEETPGEIPSLEGYPFLRFEDPLYYPLVHIRDSLNPGEEAINE